jgi:aminoglycoside phosphotransferase (APT) family kinase protein
MEHDEKVLKLVASVLGETALRAERMAYGHNSVTYDVELSRRHVIVRTNRNPEVFAGTEHNLRVLAELGLPVPQPLVVDLTCTTVPFAVMILPKIPGRDLGYELGNMAREQMTRLAEQIVSFQRRVATLPPGKGYGYTPIGAPGSHASWWEVIRPGEPPQVTAPSADLVDRLETCLLQHVARFEPYFREAPPTCFLDDLTVKNVIVQNGELQGLVDFDCVCYGDPLYWMSLTAAGVASDVGIEALFYVEELARLWELTNLQRQMLALYSAWHGLWFVRSFSARETPEWNARMLSQMTQWLDALDNSDVSCGM